MFKDYYKILGLSFTATDAEIRTAYRKLSLKWHPDKNLGIDVTSIMQDINEAYTILHNKETKERYDREYGHFSKVQAKSSYDSGKTRTDFKSKKAENIYEPRDSQENRQYKEYSSHKYEYEYDIHDEKLKEDIASAREYAKEIVKAFLNSLKRDTNKAAHGAWEGAKGYVIVGIILFFISIIVRTCTNINNNEPYSKIEYIQNSYQ